MPSFINKFLLPKDDIIHRTLLSVAIRAKLLVTVGLKFNVKQKKILEREFLLLRSFTSDNCQKKFSQWNAQKKERLYFSWRLYDYSWQVLDKSFDQTNILIRACILKFCTTNQLFQKKKKCRNFGKNPLVIICQCCVKVWVMVILRHRLQYCLIT